MNRVTTTVPPCVLHAMGADQIDEITSDPFNMAAGVIGIVVAHGTWRKQRSALWLFRFPRQQTMIRLTFPPVRLAAGPQVNSGISSAPTTVLINVLLSKVTQTRRLFACCHTFQQNHNNMYERNHSLSTSWPNIVPPALKYTRAAKHNVDGYGSAGGGGTTISCTKSILLIWRQPRAQCDYFTSVMRTEYQAAAGIGVRDFLEGRYISGPTRHYSLSSKVESLYVHVNVVAIHKPDGHNVSSSKETKT
ncbi:hypothetical protein CBL_00278 [Carabus blaptoides fortunei]